ncbi:amidase [Glaciecola sp. KUL10]|uniref:amidase n=1 Tax=Glaciecola sp. (strain KUL10) TaxID=2161813 RepID=UPI000D785399|nr:amidase [Glaciecola sp. KUL10]GBL05228.1 amidase [Glaciecola sp. KUL10]
MTRSLSTNNTLPAAFVSMPKETDKIKVASKDFSDVTLACPLANMRLAVKDLFHIDGLSTAAGNPTWAKTHPTPDTTNSSVSALIQAGARYVGKTLTDELAYSLNGQNIHYPALYNPVTPDRIVGGSSSGSAAAVSSDIADIGLGTDTGGSIRVPASYNGLFGLRTTHGVIPKDNMVPLAPSFDTVGWMCKSIELLEEVGKVLLPKSKMLASDSQANEIRIFVASNLIAASEQSREIQNWLTTLSKVAITKGEFDVIAMDTSNTFRILQGFEIWQQHGQWISANSPKFADDVEQRFKWCKSLSLTQQEMAKSQQQTIKHYVDEIFEQHDLILLPTTPGLAPLIGQEPSEMASYREELMALTAIAGLSGRPQIHLPLFKIDDAPCGLSLIGKLGEDLKLVQLAKQLIHTSKLAPKERHIQ